MLVGRLQMLKEVRSNTCCSCVTLCACSIKTTVALYALHIFDKPISAKPIVHLFVGCSNAPTPPTCLSRDQTAVSQAVTAVNGVIAAPTDGRAPVTEYTDGKCDQPDAMDVCTGES